MASQRAFVPHQRVPCEAPYRRENCDRWSYERQQSGPFKDRHNTASDACSHNGIGYYLQRRILIVQ